MEIYNYHPDTGEYLGAGLADENPLEPGKHLIPAHATTDAPPVAGLNQAAIYSAGAWSLQPDHRGRLFWDTATGEGNTITAIGVEPDPGWTDQAPGENTVWDGSAWAADIPAVITARQAQLNAELSSYIYGIYDAGTQASMQALYSQASTPAAVKTDIEAVWAWIASIVDYYYQCKVAIGDLTDDLAIQNYLWDFAQFDATCPAVTLQGIFAAL